ncbi:MAG: extracellular solute-binding protein [Ruthenibacterium sp.]
MKKILKSALSLALCGAMVLSMAACGAKKDEKPASDAAATEADILNPVGTYPIVKTPIELRIFTISAPNVEDLATNDFTKYLEEKTGVKLKFETATRDNWKEKLNLALSTNDYPDMVAWFAPDMAKYGVKENIFIQLDDLLEANAPNYVKMIGDNIGITRQTDGKIYSMGSINDCYHCMYAKKMWVNMKWIKEMGVEVPTTTEEFYDVCKKFLEINPKGIAIGGANAGWHAKFEEFIMNSFAFSPGKQQNFSDETAVDGSGKVFCEATTEEYKEGLAYMKSLYDLGAIYEGDFTQTEEQLKTLVNQADQPVLFLPTGTISNHIDVATNPELYANYEVMAPLKGPKGVQIATFMKYDGVSEGGFAITDKCKYPEAALRWADYFYTTEGSLSGQFGAEKDKDWVLDPAGKVGLNGKPALYEVLNKYSGEAQNHDWQDVCISARPAEFRLGAAVDPDVDMKGPNGLEALLYYSTKEKMEPYAQDPTKVDLMPSLKLTDDESSEIQTIGVEVEKFIAENRVAFITGKKNLEGDWDTYVKDFDRLGLPTLLKVYQTAYDRQMK